MYLLAMGFYLIGTIMLIVFAVMFAVTIIVMMSIMRRNSQRIAELMEKSKDIDYTKILSSGGGTSGSVMMHGSEGGMGSYSSTPVTKFLVVYLDGTQDIATARDGSELCKIYLSKLKND